MNLVKLIHSIKNGIKNNNYLLKKIPLNMDYVPTHMYRD